MGGEIHHKMGLALLALGEFSKASKAFDISIGISDDLDPSKLYNRGMAKLGNGEFSQALNDFEKCIDIHPDYLPAYRGRAACLLDLGQYKQALLDANRVLDYDMYDMEAYMYQGKALSKLC